MKKDKNLLTFINQNFDFFINDLNRILSSNMTYNQRIQSINNLIEREFRNNFRINLNVSPLSNFIINNRYTFSNRNNIKNIISPFRARYFTNARSNREPFFIFENKLLTRINIYHRYRRIALSELSLTVLSQIIHNPNVPDNINRDLSELLFWDINGFGPNDLNFFYFNEGLTFWGDFLDSINSLSISESMN